MDNDFMDDDWETAAIPVFNISEKETMQIKERKLVEDADVALSNELFLGEEIKVENDTQLTNVTQMATDTSITKVKPPSIRSELIKKQKQESQIRQQKKEQQKRCKEIYGEATVDKYDELYGDIAN
jgi:hypothetical protein